MLTSKRVHCVPRVLCIVWGQSVPSLTLTTQIIVQMDSTVDRSKEWGQIFSGQKWRFMSPHGHFLRPILHYRSKFQSASNDFKFGIHLLHIILRPMVKRWAQSDQQFRSYGIFCVFFLNIFSKMAQKRQKNTISIKPSVRLS